MLLIPAIDLKDGRCVRLRQGRMEEATVFSDDPVAMARRWVEAGGRRLHLVDLDGAFAGRPVNEAVIRDIVAACPEIPVQIGGGIRTEETAEAYLDTGVRYVIVGTKAVQEPEFVERLCRRFPGHVIVGLDAKDGRVAVDGWAEVSDVSAIELARRFEDAGVSAIVYTDIARDGMMQGVNAEATAELARSISIPVIASGGVRSIADIQRLCAVREAGIEGVIIGRALYEGAIDLAEAQRRADAHCPDRP
ncbi:MAG: 1-(5-phosphoribosyl)-5-[(5-phosphoribosylamino)methylideneamino]imidazole-4-carboxamide isomerase [Gammaproteobacteria bacterium]|nr:MAG: 1-(5-phosphoribosyl)-5-[(5-phosphoribosylamino)methylideneamino]imidazole-4-carboxamide isomerase [Gammaproteobacteria bacterium]